MEANELPGSVAASAIRFASGLATKIYDNMEPFWTKAVYFTGDSPYQITDLASLLPDEIFWADLGGEPPEDYNDPPIACIVVGREAFDEEEILSCIQHSSETLPSYLKAFWICYCLDTTGGPNTPTTSIKFSPRACYTSSLWSTMGSSALQLNLKKAKIHQLFSKDLGKRVHSTKLAT